MVLEARTLRMSKLTDAREVLLAEEGWAEVGKNEDDCFSARESSAHRVKEVVETVPMVTSSFLPVTRSR